MFTRIYYTTILFFLLFSACEKENEQTYPSPEDLTGHWINPEYNDTFVTFERSAGLKPDDYGFSILPDHKFIERKNTSWCGTPPVIYGDYEGTWMQVDSVIYITVGYWGGSVNYKWTVVLMNGDKLGLTTSIESY